MSFGRRLALFFVLLVVVPMVALISILVLISDDAEGGEADARLAAGVETALAIYAERAADGGAAATELARTPGLARWVAGDRRGLLLSLARHEVASGKAEAVQILNRGGAELAGAGGARVVAFGEVRMAKGASTIGTVRVSTTTASAYAARVRHLTGREVVITRGGAPLASTVTPPTTLPAPGETADLSLPEGDFRVREQPLPASNEAILMLGPPKKGGLISFGAPAAALLALFLLIAIGLAWALARTLTGLHERVAAQAATDSLTGLWNRRRMDEMLVREAERERRFGHRFSLLIVDVDDFKLVNDRFGHLQGDAVLERLAEVIGKETRAIDEGIRFGGDEMALILSETGRDGATVLAERLRQRVKETIFPLARGGNFRVTVSVGAATAPDCADDIEELVQAADQALLRAKRSGKDQTVAASTRGTRLPGARRRVASAGGGSRPRGRQREGA